MGTSNGHARVLNNHIKRESLQMLTISKSVPFCFDAPLFVIFSLDLPVLSPSLSLPRSLFPSVIDYDIPYPENGRETTSETFIYYFITVNCHCRLTLIFSEKSQSVCRGYPDTERLDNIENKKKRKEAGQSVIKLLRATYNCGEGLW